MSVTEGPSHVHVRDIIGAIRFNRVRITDHAVEESQADRLLLGQVFSSVFHGEIIESYPDDDPYPSCLVYGKAPGGEPVHSVWAFNRQTRWAVLITVYRPDPERWIDWRSRRPPDDALQ